MTRRGLSSVFFVSLVAATVPQVAGQGSTLPWPPPRYNYLESDRHSIPHLIIESLKVADINVVLEATKLEDVQKRLGGRIGYRGDAGDSEAWLCYRSNGETDKWVFWLTSDEMHATSEIADFQWRLLQTGEQADPRCTPLEENRNSIVLPLGIQLGSTQQQVRQVLGNPTAILGISEFYVHEHPAQFNNESCTVWNGVTIEFRQGKAAIIEGGKLSSC